MEKHNENKQLLLASVALFLVALPALASGIVGEAARQR